VQEGLVVLLVSSCLTLTLSLVICAWFKAKLIACLSCCDRHGHAWQTSLIEKNRELDEFSLKSRKTFHFVSQKSIFFLLK
jgi:hypothetical protein